MEGAELNIIDTDDAKKEQLMNVVSKFLNKEGFENLGRYDEMIALVRSMPTQGKEQELARLDRERTFLNEHRHLRIIWTDYSNAAPKDLASLHYKPPSGPFVEIGIYEERPGGFSAAGQAFYRRFLQDLKDRYGDSVVVATEPPPNNEQEYLSITIINIIAAIFWSAVALAIPLVLTGALSRSVLKRLPLPIMAKRIIFVVVNAWLVAPVPIPAAFVEVPVPNMFAFPWTDFSFYSHVGSYMAVSFPCTILVCILLSFRLFKGHNGEITVAI
jgi:hypothetical protein